MKIKKNNWTIHINLKGGRIVQLKKENRLILGSYNRIDGKMGNTHLCVPNFGAEGKELELPFHGFARQATWKMVEQMTGMVSISTILPQSQLYPTQLKLTQKFILDNDFIHVSEITNIGDKPVPVNLGIHYYWDTPAGWQGTQINNKDISELIENNKIMKLSNKFEINFPEQKPIIIEQSGFSSAVLWTGFKEQDNKKIYDQKYCCIEPVVESGDYFGSKKSLLSPGRSIKTEFVIQV